MCILSDFHLHTNFSTDSKTPMLEMIQKGITLGMKQLCFTEHLDFDYPVTPDLASDAFQLNIPAYRAHFLELKEQYKDQIELLFGVELGLQPCAKGKIDQLLKTEAFDFIIGSSHICNGKDPYYPEFYTNRSEHDAYLEYFTSILENTRLFSCFQVYGHLDYVVRYGPTKDKNYTYENYQDIIDCILIELIKQKKGIEINTGGYRQGLRELHPLTDIIKRYKELGGKIITIGSDAHIPDHMGSHFEKACTILKQSGFDSYTIFRNQQPYFIPLA